MRTETSSYRLCRAGQDLYAQIMAAYPQRDTRSDGWVGDASHSARRSDHNVNWNYRPGIVKALDVDKDGFPDFNSFVERIRVLASRGDRRFRGGYIIWNRKIASPNTGWRWAYYGGSNPHTSHAHFSFADAQPDFDARGSFPVRAGASPLTNHSHSTPLLRSGDRSTIVRDLQGHINAWRFARKLAPLHPDGIFGPSTKYCVEVIQQAYGLSRDGIVGPNTWSLIHRVSGGKRMESNGRTF